MPPETKFDVDMTPPPDPSPTVRSCKGVRGGAKGSDAPGGLCPYGPTDSTYVLAALTEATALLNRAAAIVDRLSNESTAHLKHPLVLPLGETTFAIYRARIALDECRSESTAAIDRNARH